ncbi:signal transduction histidine kinase/ActR/RegA family two-component response regulator [Caulobacter ginsengisoli]|uniref:histidine kinase n=1 Tax=Caulobacter ginsengisoli TaxID=400775 RepID=A0ABU0IUC1_9CAUL|nr:ATP-binding protein [Caulobacter ginsengisoli]MDQ0465605.1 signal transduction histidine kinase/ActR/RegA family two-component response regulator [Caulobacter ginsengisoli]
MRALDRLFDDQFDEIAADAAKGFWLRVGSAALTVTLMSLSVSPWVAIPWVAAFVLVEAWGLLAHRPRPPERPGATARRINQAMVGLAAIAVWTAVALIYWVTGDPALQFVAACVLTGILLAAQFQAARSTTMLAITATPPFLALAVLPLMSRDFHGLSLFMVYASIALIGLHLSAGIGAHRQAAVRLERLQREAVAANQAKSAFLAMMSHEIRTPMNGVLGMAHALAQGSLNPEQRRQVEMLTRSGDGLMIILNDILDLSKIEAGRLVLEDTVFDLHDLAKVAEELWRPAAEAKGLALACEIASEVPQWVRGDPTRVRQILLNHLSNAVKFTERGGIQIALDAPEAGVVRISVRDSGVGMTAEERAGLFEAFSQADASIARRFGGTGLGLSINRQLVEMMGGEIAVDSTPGAGSEFRITLSLPAAQAPAWASAPDAEAFSLAGLRVLVAEDNPVNQAVVQAVLSATEAVVDLADDGEAALRLLAVNTYDLVLMDIHMPTLDGIEALRRIRAGEAGRPDQPVIALTADAMDGDGERFIAMGFDGVESKPIQPARLIAAIAQLCGPWRLADLDEARLSVA